MTGSRPTASECRRRLRLALRELAQAGSTEAVREGAPRSLAEACDATRAMISAVRGSRWVPLQLYTRDELDPEAAAFRAYVDSDVEIPLANLLAETDVVRRRTAALVPPDLMPKRAFRPIVEVARSPAYVVAPIIVEGRTVGFMHLDRVGQPDDVDEEDRRFVQAFASELGVVYQNAWWAERITERGRHAAGELDRAAGALRSIAASLDRFPAPGDQPSEVRPAAGDVDRPARRDGFLTAREWEILAHMSDGATNRVIAHRLTLSEDTVKTHVRSVLRKLRVSSRGAAVARYLEIGRNVR